MSLVSDCEHKYASGNDQRKTIDNYKRFSMIQIEDGGKLVISEMLLYVGKTDPVAGMVLSNVINYLFK